MSTRSTSSAVTWRVLDAPDGVVEVRVALQVLDVVDAARGQIVEDEDLVAARQTGVREVGSDESGAAGDEHTHLGMSLGRSFLGDEHASPAVTPVTAVPGGSRRGGRAGGNGAP